MTVISPATSIAPPLNRPFLHRSTLGSFHCATRNFLFLRNPTPSSTIIAVRCQKPVSDGVSSMESINHVSSVSSSIDFLTLCHRLKTTKRKGWINQGINGAESIADHMYRMALMALIAGDLTGVDRERCIKMAIVHDIAEGKYTFDPYLPMVVWRIQTCTVSTFKCLSRVGYVTDALGFVCEVIIFCGDGTKHVLRADYFAIVGDITPSDGVPKEEKSWREKAALNEMCKVLGGGLRAEEITELWLEYENNASLEANLVKDFDKVEMILQALEYETEHGKVLDEFFISTAGKFQTEIGKSWAAEINARRKSQL